MLIHSLFYHRRFLIQAVAARWAATA